MHAYPAEQPMNECETETHSSSESNEHRINITEPNGDIQSLHKKDIIIIIIHQQINVQQSYKSHELRRRNSLRKEYISRT